MDRFSVQKGAAAGSAVELKPIKRRAPKLRKEISKCTHFDSGYYANGMCKNCYHAKGRTKKPCECDHSDRPMYAKGICKNCYLSLYHKEKRQVKRKIKQQIKA